MLKQGTNKIVANFGFALQALITDLEYIIEAWTREEMKKHIQVYSEINFLLAQFMLSNEHYIQCLTQV